MIKIELLKSITPKNDQSSKKEKAIKNDSKFENLLNKLEKKEKDERNKPSKVEKLANTKEKKKTEKHSKDKPPKETQNRKAKDPKNTGNNNKIKNNVNLIVSLPNTEKNNNLTKEKGKQTNKNIKIKIETNPKLAKLITPSKSTPIKSKTPDDKKINHALINNNSDVASKKIGKNEKKESDKSKKVIKKELNKTHPIEKTTNKKISMKESINIEKTPEEHKKDTKKLSDSSEVTRRAINIKGKSFRLENHPTGNTQNKGTGKEKTHVKTNSHHVKTISHVEIKNIKSSKPIIVDEKTGNKENLKKIDFHSQHLNKKHLQNTKGKTTQPKKDLNTIKNNIDETDNIKTQKISNFIKHIKTKNEERVTLSGKTKKPQTSKVTKTDKHPNYKNAIKQLQVGPRLNNVKKKEAKLIKKSKVIEIDKSKITRKEQNKVYQDKVNLISKEDINHETKFIILKKDKENDISLDIFSKKQFFIEKEKLNPTKQTKKNDFTALLQSPQNNTQPSETHSIKHNELHPPLDKIYEQIEQMNNLKPPVTKSLTIQLNPPSLGSLHVKVSIDVNKNLSATIAVHDKDTFKTISNHLDTLKNYLVNTGIKVQNIDVHNSFNDGFSNHLFSNNSGNYQQNSNFSNNQTQQFDSFVQDRNIVKPQHQVNVRQSQGLDITV